MKKNLTAFMIVVMMMLFALPISAQTTVGYAQWDSENKTLTFSGGTSVPEGAYELNTGANTPGWNSLKSTCTKVVFDDSFKYIAPTSCYQWFYNFTSLETIEGIKNLNTSEVTDMSSMFSGCSSLTSLDLSNFNTSNVESMSYMFYNCSKLTSLNLSSFNTSKVKDMTIMFYNCSRLTSLDLSNFNTSNVTSMSYMFYNCQSLTSLDLSKFDTSKVTNLSNMFRDCSRLTSLDLSNFDTSKVKDMTIMFRNCESLISLDLSSFNTSNVTSMSYMFYKCSKLTSLDLSNFDTSNVTSMDYMFNGCSKLTSLGLSSFNTSNVKNMVNMFNDCESLTSLDLSNFNTSKVMNMSYMFSGCSNLGSIYVCDDFKTDKVSNGTEMFKNCSNLKGAESYNSSQITHTMANYKTGYFKTYYQQGDTKTELFGETLSVESLDLSGDKDFVAHAPFTANTVSYARNLSASTSTWFSLCLPFAYTPNNFTAYQLNSAKGDVVELEQITGEIAAGTPVLFKFKDGENKEINISATDAQIVKAPVDGTAVNGPDGSLQLCGTYQTKTFSSEDNNAFILLNNKLMNPAKMWENTKVTKVSVKPFRAYMTSTAGSLESSARAFSIGFGEDEEGTTAIDQLNTIATDDAEYYDSNGRRISGPVKGLNIVRRGNKTMKLIIK